MARGTVDFVYDLAGHEVAQVSSAGAWTRGEVYAGGRHLAMYSGGTGGTTYFIHADWLGTERARSTVAGAPYETCTSLPFGDWLTCVGGDPSPMHFTGKEHDTESNLDNFGARYNSSSLGRFMSPDSKPTSQKLLVDPQDLNLYLYTIDNPLRYYDPNGQDWRDAIKAAINTLAIDLHGGVGVGLGQKIAGIGLKGSVEYGFSLKINSREMSLSAQNKIKGSAELGPAKGSLGPEQSQQIASVNWHTGEFSGPGRVETQPAVSLEAGSLSIGASGDHTFTIYASQGTAIVPVGDVPVPVTGGGGITVDSKAVSDAFWKDNTPAPQKPPTLQPPPPPNSCEKQQDGTCR